jgi:hypothetical protein
LPNEVHDNKDQHRFELAVNGHTAFTQYALTPGKITLMHTEVPKEFEGHGIGSKLVRGELEAVRAQGLKVVARCPFVAAYIKKHPEFQDLLA